MTKVIGGYFELELIERYDNTRDAIALNSARNCLRYIIKAYEIKEIFLPYYTCPVVWQAVRKENCRINFYHIDEHFMPEKEFEKEDYILYTNYFGVCGKNVKKLSAKYKNIIIDNSQAFYMPKYGIASFNSIRKFFGVPDGALLYCDRILEEEFEKSTSYQKCAHLLKRLDVSMNFGYQDFCFNEEILLDEDIKTISNLTKSIFNTIDIQKAKEKRLENYRILSSELAKSNKLQIKLDEDDVPMYYPYMVDNYVFYRNLFAKNNIEIPLYWNNLPKDFPESNLRNKILLFPIDQRYAKEDMKRILEIMKKEQ